MLCWRRVGALRPSALPCRAFLALAFLRNARPAVTWIPLNVQK